MINCDENMTWSQDEIEDRKNWYKKYYQRSNIDFLIRTGMIPKHVYIQLSTYGGHEIIGFDGLAKKELTPEEKDDLKRQNQFVSDNFAQLVENVTAEFGKKMQNGTFSSKIDER